MLWAIGRFFRAAGRALADSARDGVTLGAFLERHAFGDALVRHYVRPMGGAIWSASAGTMRQFPAASSFRFLDNHGRLLARAGEDLRGA